MKALRFQLRPRDLASIVGAPSSIGMKIATAISAVLFVTAILKASEAQSPISSSTDFQKAAMRLRENALLKLETCRWSQGTNFRSGIQSLSVEARHRDNSFLGRGAADSKQPVPNYKSSWDQRWAQNYGGLDDPDPALGETIIPAKFVPAAEPILCCASLQ